MPDEARPLAAEQVALDGITVNKTGEDKIQVNSITLADSEDIASVDLRISLEESTEASAEVSLNDRVSLEESSEASAEVSLNDRVSLEESTEASAEVSLNARVSLEESTETAQITSIDARLAVEEATTQIKLNIPVTGGASHINIDYANMGYENGDTIIVNGMMRDAEDDADNPIIATQISGTASHTGVTFVFSDDIPTNNSSTIHGDNSDYVMDVAVQKKMNS